MHSDFLEPCVVKDIGDYKNASELGLADNSISSIRVGASVQVCACEGENFEVACERFCESDLNLEDNFPRTAIGNDMISSVKVSREGAECQAVIPEPPERGYSQLAVLNCHLDGATVHVWIRDITTGAPFSEKGSLPAQPCPPDGSPLLISLTDDHSYEFVAVDPTACGVNDPHMISCQKLLQTGIPGGNASSPVYTIKVY
jgi:hypothetical protein